MRRMVQTQTRRPKLLFLVDNLADGGAQRVASEVGQGLSDEVEVKAVLFENRVTYVWNHRVESLELKNSPIAIGKLIGLIKKIVRLRAIVAAERPIAVLSFMEGANYLNILVRMLTAKNRYRCIISVHTNLSKALFVGGYLSAIHRFMIRLLYNRADKVIAVSHGVAKDLVESFAVDERQIEVIHNPVDLRSITMLGNQNEINLRLDADIPYIANLGRLTYAKGHRLLLQAFRLILGHVRCRLVIIGDGELRAELEEEAKDQRVSSEVLFAGYRSNPFPLLSRARVFAFPSIYEGFAIALVEAMACGCPVVATDCDYGPREILAPTTAYRSGDDGVAGVEEQEFGILVPPNNAARLAEGMLAMLTDEGKRQHYAKMAVRRAQDFDVLKVARRYESILLNRDLQ